MQLGGDVETDGVAWCGRSVVTKSSLSPGSMDKSHVLARVKS